MVKNSESISSKSVLDDMGIKLMTLKPVGIISSPFKETFQTPRQGRHAHQISQITIFKEYLDALDGIERHKYIIVLYWLDRAERDLLKVIPAGKTKKRGVFSTRAPARPNPIAFSIAEIISVDKTKSQVKITVKGLEALDGSILVDIKPYAKEIDCINDDLD
jgi:tRNA (adenine37-N6)-methyltransferase